MSYIGNAPLYQAFITDTFSGTGSQTAFTMTVAPANTASVLVAVSGVLQAPSTYSVNATTLTFSAAPPSGTANISVRYLGVPASGVTTTAYSTRTEFTATSGQTTFTTSSYTVGFIQVYRNGVLLGTTDYTATSGTTVVLAVGATAGDLVTTISFYVSSVLNAIPNATGSITSSNLPANLSLVTPSVTTTLGVGGATPSASGAGISFPATQSASSDANTLDDYEEGTFNPDFKNAGSSSTFTIKWGQYIKIGQQVTCWGGFDGGNTGTAGTTVTITNLPFTANSNGTTAFCAGTLAYNAGTSQYMAIRGAQGAVNFDLYTNSANVTQQITYGVFFVTYRTSA